MPHGHRLTALDDSFLQLEGQVTRRVCGVRGAGARVRVLGNRIAAMWAPLPVGVIDPVQRLRQIADAMAGIKRSGQAVGAHTLTELAGFASPNLVAQAARLQARQRLFKLVVTNVPGPQVPLYRLGRRMQAIYPMVRSRRTPRWVSRCSATTAGCTSA